MVSSILNERTNYHCPECGESLRMEGSFEGTRYHVCPVHGAVDPAEWDTDTIEKRVYNG